VVARFTFGRFRHTCQNGNTAVAIITVAGQVSEVMDHYGLWLMMVNQAQMIGAQDEIFEVVKGLHKKPKCSGNCETGLVASGGGGAF
jgi:hypothetical protein